MRSWVLSRYVRVCKVNNITVFQMLLIPITHVSGHNGSDNISDSNHYYISGRTVNNITGSGKDLTRDSVTVTDLLDRFPSGIGRMKGVQPAASSALVTSQARLQQCFRAIRVWTTS